MKFIKEHWFMLLVVVGIFGIFGYNMTHHSPATSSSANSFTTADMSSPMTEGSKEAKVSLIQYSDFLCPSCSYFTTQLMPTIKKDYIDTGKVKFEFRPMAFIAPGSVTADEGGYCAIDQDKFWQYHNAVYTYVANQVFNYNKDPKTDTILTADLVKSIASQAGLDATSFNSCLDSNKYQSEVTAATQKANAQGITATPYILVNGHHYQGDMTLTSVEALIKSQL